ncbi:MAG: hypothetical protein AB8B62_04200 [Roseobacter sp.]
MAKLPAVKHRASYVNVLEHGAVALISSARVEQMLPTRSRGSFEQLTDGIDLAVDARFLVVNFAAF